MNEKVTTAVRIIFGLFCLFFGINNFAQFIIFPTIPGDGGELLRIYVESGFMNLIGVMEILGGLALLLKKYIPLALTVLIAILFNATLFHVLHDPKNIAGALLGLIMGLILVYAYKVRFFSVMSS